MADMAEISSESSEMKEGQRNIRRRFEAMESDCCACQCQSRKETAEILMHSATAQLRILSDFSLAVFQTSTSQNVFGGFHEGLNAVPVPQDRRSSVGSNDLQHQGNAC
ncbi:hypothetical protein GQ457_04G031070 [Hibiscus cannabinus]